ncbi:MAG: glycyl-radical enzyme activating protein, partial [Lentisphaeria bacterium]|nr:glycyl-radical enzyme activating protein [Lentisphaeria bacterium]
MNDIKTLVFDIEKFAVHDGPGIRTVVFMKGCPLHCLWCHNPESQSFEKEIFFNSAQCTFCNRCAAICRAGCHTIAGKQHIFDRTNCLRCGKCAENCPADALKLCGREMSVHEVIEEVLKDKVFYENSGGGITLSGGEPLAHFDFTFELLKAAKENGLHTAVETSGFASPQRIEKILPLVDLWLWDLKAEAAKHEVLTGVPSEPILKNLRKV